MTKSQHIVWDTLIYFSVNKRLATSEEIFRYQIRGSLSLDQIISILVDLPQVMFRHGVYGFADEFEELWALRQEKIRESIRRFRKLKRWGRMLISIPMVEAIFVAGSLGFSSGNAKKTSDIDLFVVTSPGRIWLTRFLVTLVTQMTGTRRRGDYDENLFCLNHYVTRGDLVRRDHDIYAAQLYADFIPLGGKSIDVLQQFQIHNSWVRGVFPQARLREYRTLSKLTAYPGSQFFTWILASQYADILEMLARLLQKSKILANPLTKKSQARIKATDQELEFHPVPNSIRLEALIRDRRQQLSL